MEVAEKAYEQSHLTLIPRRKECKPFLRPLGRSCSYEQRAAARVSLACLPSFDTTTQESGLGREWPPTAHLLMLATVCQSQLDLFRFVPHWSHTATYAGPPFATDQIGVKTPTINHSRSSATAVWSQASSPPSWERCSRPATHVESWRRGVEFSAAHPTLEHIALEVIAWKKGSCLRSPISSAGFNSPKKPSTKSTAIRCHCQHRTVPTTACTT